MTDHELLNLAAKAVGIETTRTLQFSDGAYDLEGKRWNPLADDGDALRVAVQLGLLGAPYMPIKFVEAVGDANPYAATRRAIVRAAANIGKDMARSDEWDEGRMDIIGTNGNDGLHYVPT